MGEENRSTRNNAAEMRARLLMPTWEKNIREPHTFGGDPLSNFTKGGFKREALQWAKRLGVPLRGYMHNNIM